jgi:hypothetical protein
VDKPFYVGSGPWKHVVYGIHPGTLDTRLILLVALISSPIYIWIGIVTFGSWKQFVAAAKLAFTRSKWNVAPEETPTYALFHVFVVLCVIAIAVEYEIALQLFYQR